MYNKIINYLCLSFALLFCAVNSMELSHAVYSAPNNTLDLSKLNITLDDLPVDQECKNKIQTEVKARVNEIQQNVLKNGLTEDKFNVSIKEDYEKLTEQRNWISCCSDYGAMDTLLKSIKQCNEGLGNQLQKGMENTIKEKEQSSCTKYKYHSSQCNEIAGKADGKNGACSLNSSFVLMSFFTLLISFLLYQN